MKQHRVLLPGQSDWNRVAEKNKIQAGNLLRFINEYKYERQHSYLLGIPGAPGPPMFDVVLSR